MKYIDADGHVEECLPTFSDKYLEPAFRPLRPTVIGRDGLAYESMKVQAEIGEFVNRRGIYPPLPDADKIKFVQMHRFAKEELDTKKKEFQKIFLQ